jgi:hypothetical protein
MMARLVVMIQNNQEKMMAKLDAHHERMTARIDSQIEKMEAAVNVFEERLNKMDATDLEANRGKLEDVAEQQDIPKEDDMVKIIGTLEDRYGERHLAIGCSRQPKKQTQGDGGSWQKLAAAHRQMTAMPLLHHSTDTAVSDQTRTKPKVIFK